MLQKSRMNSNRNRKTEYKLEGVNIKVEKRYILKNQIAYAISNVKKTGKLQTYMTFQRNCRRSRKTESAMNIVFIK